MTTPLRSIVLGCLLLAPLGCVPGARAASIAATCDVVVHADTTTLDIGRADSPYERTRLDLDNDFRFAAQVLDAPPRLKTYVYFHSKRRYVLIHAGVQRLSAEACGTSLGRNTVLSPRLENELSFECRPRCK